MLAERLFLATRPHRCLIARRRAGSLLLIMCGLALHVFGQQLGRLLAGFVPGLLGPPGIPGSAGTDAQVSVVSVAAFGFEELLDEVFARGWLVLTAIGVLILARAALNRHSTEYGITVSSGSTGSPGSQGRRGRIIKVQGVLSRQTVTVALSMVNDLVLYEPLLGRILGRGPIDIETGSDYAGDRLEYVADPLGFQTVCKTLLDYDHVDQGHDRRRGFRPL